MAAYTAAGRIGSLALMPVETLAGSLSVYAGQNLGAGWPERIRQGIRAALVLCLGTSVVLGAGLLAGGGWLARLFLTTPPRGAGRGTAISADRRGARLLDGFMQVYQQVLRGVNHPNQALAGGIVQLAVRVLLVAIGAWGLHNLDVVWLAWPWPGPPAVCFHSGSAGAI